LKTLLRGILLLGVLANLFLSCSASKERRAELEQMLTEYNQLIDETMAITQRMAGGDLNAMGEMAAISQKATAFTEKWQSTMERLGPELSQSDKDFLEAEFKKNTERMLLAWPRP